jgi:lipid-A-disaccharide synthase
LSTVNASSSIYVIVSAVEPSADLHAAHLVEEVARIRPDIRFGGFGGDHMRRAGCEVVRDVTASATMAFGFLGGLGRYAKLLREFDRLLVEKKPSAVLLVDSPALNFLFARLARWRGISVAYYILPQIWAWAPWRRRKVLKYTDLLMSILPFEEELYKNDRVPVTYVGHPLGDELADLPCEWGEELREKLSIDPGTKLIGVFPGSRTQEVERLTPTFCSILKKMALDPERQRVIVSCLREDFKARVAEAAMEHDIRVDVVTGDSRALMQACDFAIVASGTASLQLAYFEKPMIVLYRASKFGARMFGRFSVTPWIALPNIVGSGVNGGEATVVEKIFWEDPSAELAPIARSLLDDGPPRDDALARLSRLKKSCFQPGSGVRAAKTVLKFLDDVSGGKTP